MLSLASKHRQFARSNTCLRSLFQKSSLSGPHGVVLTLRRALSSPSFYQLARQDWKDGKAHSKLEPNQFQTVEQHLKLPPKKWDDFTRQVVEDNAVRKAIAGQANTLFACLWSYIKDGNPTAVIDLYGRYAQGIQGAAASQGEDNAELVEEEEEEQTIFLDVEPEDVPAPFDHDRVRVLLSVITAHAMQDSLEHAFQTYMSTDVGFNIYIDNQFLEQLNFDSSLRTKVAQYIQDIKIAKMLSDPVLFSKYVKNLSKGRAIQPLWDLYQNILQGISRPHPYIAINNPTSPSLLVSMTEIGWGSFLSSFLRCDRPDLAGQVWKDLERLDIPRTTPLWTTLLDGFDHLRISAPAVASWKQMVMEGIKPDALTYRAVISVCLRDSQVAYAMDKFAEFREAEKQGQFDMSRRVSVYNTVLDGLLMNKSLPQALSLLKEMRLNGPQPDVVTYNTLLGYYHRRGDFNGLVQVIAEMEEAKVRGDVYTFSTILSSLLKAGRADAAEVVFQCMEEQGVKANVAIYTALIDSQLRTRTETNLRAALALLDRMEKDRTIRPNDVTYTAVLTNIHRGNWLPAEKAASYQRTVLRRMGAQGVKLNLPSYHTILKSCLESENENGVEHALGYYEEIKKRKIPLVQTTWYILIAGLIQRGEWDIAQKIVRDMTLSGIKPSASLTRLVTKIMQRTS